MEQNLYAVKDELTGTFYQPTTMENDEVAKRQFKTQVNGIELWKENASDFSLFVLGVYNTETGVITPKVEKIVGGRSVLDA